MIDAVDVIVDLLARGHAVEFRVRGDSMHPTIREDELLHVVPVDRASIRRGHIVLVMLERGLTAHRVVRRDGDVIVTRGDNAPHADEAVHIERVMGKVRVGVRRRIAAALVRRLRASRS